MRTPRIAVASGLLLLALGAAGCASQAGAGSADPVVGTWQSSDDNAPYLEFADDGTFRGNDGCNGLSGSYEQNDDTVTLRSVVSTMKACMDVDDWLSKAASVIVGADSLEVRNAEGTVIGTLAKSS